MHGDDCKAPFVDMVCKPWVYKLEVQVQEWIDGTPLAHWSRTSRFLFLSLLFIPLWSLCSMWYAHVCAWLYIYMMHVYYNYWNTHTLTAYDTWHMIHDIHWCTAIVQYINYIYTHMHTVRMYIYMYINAHKRCTCMPCGPLCLCLLCLLCCCAFWA